MIKFPLFSALNIVRNVKMCQEKNPAEEEKEEEAGETNRSYSLLSLKPNNGRIFFFLLERPATRF